MDKLKLITISAIILTLASCGKQVEFQTIRKPETAEEREAVASMILKLCEVSNPMSDEEPEDMIRQAENTAWRTLCEERVYKVTINRGTGFRVYELQE
jgi:hypothetical protein